MGTKVIETTAWTKAGPDEVFAVLADSGSWPAWSAIGEARLEETGSPDPEGVGALRHFTTGRVHSRERVVGFEPGRHFAYELVSGLPLKSYRADVELSPSDGGTSIRWRSTYDGARVPGTTWIYQWQLRKFIVHLVDDLAKRADAVAADRVANADS